jgi:chromosome segregation protein
VFLKSLCLKGFKSFADPTTLEFEPGVTVVVGPNGSGKSNIVDAVAWVLGAQGPRTVRSAKMDDVIFAGSPRRSALGRAEVSLTIDNCAGLLPIDFSEVTITRILFRSGDSEYAINGVPCRLLDVQDLLSDTGVGRQQHVIVSQGQLDAVLNSRPEDRRLIIEEAAGVLKYRRRREKAQRRLESTEASLVRLQDLLREVRRQLRPLERQADAARRHEVLVRELHEIRRFLAGRDLVAVEARLASAARSCDELARTEEEQRRMLATLDAGVAVAEGALSAARDRAETADLPEALSRAEGLRARAGGVAAVLAERQRSLERSRAAAVDENVVANLEFEGARLAAELADVDRDAAGLAPQAEELARAEAALADQAGGLDAHWGDRPSPSEASEAGEPLEASEASEREASQASEASQPSEPAVRAAAEMRGELGARRSGVDRSRAELRRSDAGLDVLGRRVARLSEEADALAARTRKLADGRAPLGAALAGAVDRRQTAESVLGAAEAQWQASQAEEHRWEARAEALAAALEDALARADTRRLADVAGVLGVLPELVEVDDGWESAFEAAAGEALSAAIVEDVDAARRSLAHLRGLDLPGAVLALPAGPADSTGSGLAPAATTPPPSPPGTQAVRAHVRSRRPGVDRLLDRLLWPAVAVAGDWAQALDTSLAHPELIVVTLQGDRFAASVWRAGAATSGVTGAALEEARSETVAAAAAAADLAAAVEVARAERLAALAEEADLGRRVDGNRTELIAASDALARVEAEAREAAHEHEAQIAHGVELADRLLREEGRVAELERALPSVEASAAAEIQRSLAERLARSRLAERTSVVAALRRDLEVRVAGLEERRGLLTQRLAEVEERLRHRVQERAQAGDRRRKLEREASATARLAALVVRRAKQLDAAVEALRAARRAETDTTRTISDRLEARRRERSATERQLAEVRERAARLQIDQTEAKVRLETLVDGIRRELDCEPDATRGATCPPLPAGTSPAARARELERELRLLGPINPLALQEHSELEERHRFLEAQLEDVRAGRRELTKVIRAVDAEIVEVFRAAYADVSENFDRLFATLFPGGQGGLRLTEPDRLLDTGIELEARPSGKNVRRLSLLSGGERSLTALAFLFAVFRSRPSPFYLMDEVEAALDDVNLHRFLDLIHEFRDEAQLLVVSHQKRTMEAADCLYGVTMQPGGSSLVVSERIVAGT